MQAYIAIEKYNNVYYFANCIPSTDIKNKNFVQARIEIANSILSDLQIINE